MGGDNLHLLRWCSAAREQEQAQEQRKGERFHTWPPLADPLLCVVLKKRGSPLLLEVVALTGKSLKLLAEVKA